MYCDVDPLPGEYTVIKSALWCRSTGQWVHRDRVHWDVDLLPGEYTAIKSALVLNSMQVPRPLWLCVLSFTDFGWTVVSRGKTKGLKLGSA